MSWLSLRQPPPCSWEGRPPRDMPKVLEARFTMDGKAVVLNRYRDDSYQTYYKVSLTWVSQLTAFLAV